ATAALAFLAKGKIDTVQSTLKDTKGSLTRTQGDLQTTKNDLKKTTEERDAANTKAEETQKTLDTTKTELTGVKGEQEAAQTAATAKETEITELKDKLAKATAPVVPGEKSEDPRLAPLQAEVQTAKAAEAEAKMMLEKTIAQGKDNEAKLGELQKKEQDRE